jgi:hypothetical protein
MKNLPLILADIRYASAEDMRKLSEAMRDRCEILSETVQGDLIDTPAGCLYRAAIYCTEAACDLDNVASYLSLAIDKMEEVEWRLPI